MVYLINVASVPHLPKHIIDVVLGPGRPMFPMVNVVDSLPILVHASLNFHLGGSLAISNNIIEHLLMSIWVDDKLIDKQDGYHFECFDVYVVGDWSLLNELYTF